ncbi:MAG: NAD(P)/FAD-dependent oxidoreductase [Geobacteraceae bacterium]
MKIVTAGTGMAAAEFVEQLRLGGFDGEIVMISDEDCPPYSPCVIPFYLAGEALDTVFWKGRDFFEKYRVTPRLGSPVVQVEPDRQRLRTADGMVEDYDRLFFATGSQSRYPRPEWLDTRGVFGFKTLTDMMDIDRYLREEPVTEAVVFGGGFIGVDAALALQARGLNVTLVHRNTRLLSQMTDEEGGQFATAKLAQKTGLDIRLRTTVEEIFQNNGQLTGVRLADGHEIASSLLILSVGVTPNSAPLQGDDTGICSNEQMLADPCIYTAGDVAVTRHAVNGTSGVYANYPNAMRQARVAARHLLHGDGSYEGSINTTVLRKHIDFPVISAGDFSGEAITWQQGDIWRRVYLVDGMINGFLIIGDTRLSGYLYQQYKNRARVDGTIRKIISSPRHDGQYREMLGFAAA